ncbi:MAG: putative integral rane protein [Thermoleophilia bacterium]|nr:putative integral rane protein [Thermoleophilia bacterium]
MVTVFAAFATAHLAEMQQMGAGLAIAILIDATIIRGLLLPAVMVLLGRGNWYLPTWLRWLPHVAADGRLPDAAPAGAVAPAAGTVEVQPRELDLTR